MRTPTPLLALLALLALVTPALAWNEPDGFRGVPWGTSRFDLRIHLQGAGESVRCVTSGCQSDITIGPVPVRAVYVFAPDTDKFERVILSFTPAHYETLLTIFKERYGAPSSVKEQAMQNRMGAKFTNESAIWSGERVTITLTRYGSKLDKGLAGISLTAAHERQREESQKALKKGKDDL